jgi:hypothetical protein
MTAISQQMQRVHDEALVESFKKALAPPPPGSPAYRQVEAALARINDATASKDSASGHVTSADLAQAAAQRKQVQANVARFPSQNAGIAAAEADALARGDSALTQAATLQGRIDNPRPGRQRTVLDVLDGDDAITIAQKSTEQTYNNLRALVAAQRDPGILERAEKIGRERALKAGKPASRPSPAVVRRAVQETHDLAESLLRQSARNRQQQAQQMAKSSGGDTWDAIVGRSRK